MVQTPFEARRLITIENFYIPHLKQYRKVRVYLPIGYHDNQQSYPVLYMHDGQNVIDPVDSYAGETWQVPETLDRFEQEGISGGIILVAVDNNTSYPSARMDEYSPWPKERAVVPGASENILHSGGKGLAYTNFIAETLKPYIDSHFRTLPQRQHTWIAGSSMGGFISLYAIFAHQDTFSVAGVFSPAFWFAENAMQQFIVDTPIKETLSVYMDMGTEESSDAADPNFPQIYLNGSRRVFSLCQRKGAQLNIQYQEAELATHCEKAWAERFPHFIEFALSYQMK